MAYAALLDRTLPLPRHRVYERLADFGGVSRLMPEAIVSLTLEGDGIGAVRKVRLNGVEGELHERLEALVEDRLVSYSIVNDSPMPFDRYHAVVTLDDAPGGGCRVRWGSNWIARGVTPAEVVTMVTGIYAGLLDGVERLG